MPAASAFSPDAVVIGDSERMRAVFEFVRLIADGHPPADMIANVFQLSQRSEPDLAADCIMNTPIPTRIASPTIDPGEQSVHPVSLDERLREVERDLISWALRVTHGNKSKAADLLRVKRSTLGDRIARCGLIVEAGERRGGS